MDWLRLDRVIEEPVRPAEPYRGQRIRSSFEPDSPPDGEETQFLGVQIDRTANAGGADDREVSAPGASCRVFIVAAREDLEIARQVREVLA